MTHRGDEGAAREGSGADPGPAARPDIRTLHLWQIQPLRDLLVLASVVGIVYLGYKLSPLTVPMLLALTLAYLFEPVMRLMTRGGRMRREIASMVLIVVAAIAIAVPVLVGGSFAVVQGASYATRIWEQAAALQKVAAEPRNPTHLEQLRPGGWRKIGEFIRDAETGQLGRPRTGGIPEGSGQPGATPTTDGAGMTERSGAADAGTDRDAEPSDVAEPVPTTAKGTEAETIAAPGIADEDENVVDRAVAFIATWARDNTGTIGRITRQVFGTGADALAALLRFVKALVVLGFSLFLTGFFFFFFSSRYAAVSESLLGLIPERNKDKWLGLLGNMDRVIAAFVRGRLTIMAIMSLLYVLAYWLIGVPAPLVVGLIVGCLSAVPYMALIGVPLSIVLMFLMPVGEPKAWWYILLVPTATYWLIQLTDDYIWTPLIQGKATDMDTPTILFAVLAGGMLGGFYGILLAIPIGACLKIVIKEVLMPRFRAWAEGRASDFLPISKGAGSAEETRG